MSTERFIRIRSAEQLVVDPLGHVGEVVDSSALEGNAERVRRAVELDRTYRRHLIPVSRHLRLPWRGSAVKLAGDVPSLGGTPAPLASHPRHGTPSAISTST